LIDRRTLIQATGASVMAGSVKVAQAAPTTGQSGGASDVPDYRAYIGGPFNSMRAEFPHNHPDDTTAIEAAKQLVNGYDVELWDRERFVDRLSPEAK
jgi:hypothetical protein